MGMRSRLNVVFQGLRHDLRAGRRSEMNAFAVRQCLPLKTRKAFGGRTNIPA
jgi:hypothetical protein